MTQSPSSQPTQIPASAGNRELIMLEQYKLAVEMADRVSSRRIHLGSYFLSVNTAGLSALGYLIEKNILSSLYLSFLAFIGVAICVVWLAAIDFYRKLNAAKFDVIHQMESSLPCQMYKDEWDIYKTYNRGGFTSSQIEGLTPIVLIVLYVVLFVVILK